MFIEMYSIAVRSKKQKPGGITVRTKKHKRSGNAFRFKKFTFKIAAAEKIFFLFFTTPI